MPYCYWKLVTNVIRAVKINVLSYFFCGDQVYKLVVTCGIDTGWNAVLTNQHSGLDPHVVYNTHYTRGESNPEY